MNQPQGYIEKGKEDHVCYLKKFIYGLKQSPRCKYNRTIFKEEKSSQGSQCEIQKIPESQYAINRSHVLK